MRAENRTFDGTGNNLEHPPWGSAGTNFARQAPAGYLDGVSIPDAAGRPNPRAVGVSLMQQNEPRPNARKLSGYVYGFGNLISHDIQHTQSGSSESPGIPDFPSETTFLLRTSACLAAIPLRSSHGNGRRQSATAGELHFRLSRRVGDLTPRGWRAWRHSAGRAGQPRRKTSARVTTLTAMKRICCPATPSGRALDAPFVAGDSRVNDNVVLTCLHTIFMREHNRLVDELSGRHPRVERRAAVSTSTKVRGGPHAIDHLQRVPARR